MSYRTSRTQRIKTAGEIVCQLLFLPTLVSIIPALYQFEINPAIYSDNIISTTKIQKLHTFLLHLHMTH